MSTAWEHIQEAIAGTERHRSSAAADFQTEAITMEFRDVWFSCISCMPVLSTVSIDIREISLSEAPPR